MLIVNNSYLNQKEIYTNKYKHEDSNHKDNNIPNLLINPLNFAVKI